MHYETIVFAMFLFVLIYSECPDKCSSCKNSLDSPAKLPCGHFVCDVCVKEMTVCKEDDCNVDIPENYDYDPSQDNIE